MKRIRANHLLLSLALVLVLIVACGPTPAPTEPPPPPPTEAPAPTDVPPTEAPPEPTAEPEPAAKEQLIIAYDSDIDHIELMHLLQSHGVAAGAVLNQAELMSDPHIKEREFYFELVSASWRACSPRRPNGVRSLASLR